MKLFLIAMQTTQLCVSQRPSDADGLSHTVTCCLSDVRGWMSSLVSLLLRTTATIVESHILALMVVQSSFSGRTSLN